MLLALLCGSSATVFADGEHLHQPDKADSLSTLYRSYLAHDFPPAVDAALHTYRIGDGDKTIVIMFGGTPGNGWQNERVGRQVFEMLGPDSSVILVDMHGAGLSAKTGVDPNDPIGKAVEHVHEIVSEIRKKHPGASIHLFGHSAGALLSTAAVKDVDEKGLQQVDGLIISAMPDTQDKQMMERFSSIPNGYGANMIALQSLVDGGHNDNDRELQFMARDIRRYVTRVQTEKMLDTLRRHKMPDFLTSNIAQLNPGHLFRPIDFMKDLIKFKIVLQGVGKASFLDQLNSYTSPNDLTTRILEDSMRFLASPNAPQVTIFTGERDPLVTPEKAEIMRETYAPNSRKVEPIKGATHANAFLPSFHNGVLRLAAGYWPSAREAVRRTATEISESVRAASSPEYRPVIRPASSADYRTRRLDAFVGTRP